MKTQLIARAGIVACTALAALVLVTALNAEARSMRSPGGMSASESGLSKGPMRTNVMGPHGNGPVIDSNQTWRNNQGGLLGGGWPPPRRNPCTWPGNSAPTYGC